MLSFGEALRWLRFGKRDQTRVARQGWNGVGMYVYLHQFPGFEPCLVLHTAQGTEQPGWLASQADMLAEDWVLVDHPTLD